MSKIVLVDDVYAELRLIEGILKSANHTVVSYMSTDKLEEKLAIRQTGREARHREARPDHPGCDHARP